MSFTMIEPSVMAVTPSLKQPFLFTPASVLTEKPVKIQWIVENFIEAGSTNLLYGEPGAGKSLVALDWGFCVAAGLEWHGQRTKSTGVFYVAGEGYSGIGRRLKALESKYRIKAPANMFISKQSAQLLDPVNAQWVANSIKSMYPTPGLVIIDTLHRNMDGDENSSQDIGRFVSNLDNFMKPLGAAVLIVHHSGHGDKQRSRGSSSIRAAMDGEFSTTKIDGGIVLSCQKAKDFESFKPIGFILKTTPLEGWFNDDGEPMTSVCLEYSVTAAPIFKQKKLSTGDQTILASLEEAIATHGIEPTAAIKAKYPGFDLPVGEMKKIVAIKYWSATAYKSNELKDKKDNTRRQAFFRARENLFNQGYTIEHDDHVWLKLNK